ncbi:MAG: hypothetical protein ACE360_09415 [Hyphomicrobiales bacterium]
MVNHIRMRVSAAPLRLLAVGGLALALSGCASVSVPFGDVFGAKPEPLHTASIATPEAEAETAVDAPVDAPMPPELSAVAPVASAAPSAPSERPVDDLIASLPSESEPRVTLTQADLNAMGRALTHVLSTDEDAGTFSWSHEATGRSGLMTPFRQLSASGQGACRVVSVEITDNGKDTILLADACMQNGAWVFVTPRAGQVL